MHRSPRRIHCYSYGLSLLLIIFAGTSNCFAAGEAASDGRIRIVNCNANVRSLKRGVCANHLSAEDFRVLSPGVSWWYNWSFETDDSPPAGVSMEFFPMAWGDSPSQLNGLEQYLAAGHRP